MASKQHFQHILFFFFWLFLFTGNVTQKKLLVLESRIFYHAIFLSNIVLILCFIFFCVYARHIDVIIYYAPCKDGVLLVIYTQLWAQFSKLIMHAAQRTGWSEGEEDISFFFLIQMVPSLIYSWVIYDDSQLLLIYSWVIYDDSQLWLSTTYASFVLK